MNQSKLAQGILTMLNDSSRKKLQIKLAIIFVLILIATAFAHQWESPLAIIPQTFLHIAIGYMLLYWQSLSLYSKLKRYFNIEVIEQDAQAVE